jgi:hypothetical protein
VSSRIREEFARFFRTYARRKHRHSIFFSDQLLRTLLAFDLLNPGQRKGVSPMPCSVHTVFTDHDPARKKRYREALRREVASTVSDPADVDQELHYLYQILMT